MGEIKVKKVGMKAIAVIPAYNDGKHVGAVVRGAVRYVDEVIAVDDGSRDSTGIVADKAGANVIRLAENRGQGYATRIGVERALKLGAGWIVLLDADGQHPPDKIPELLGKLGKGYDFVFTVRKRDAEMPVMRRFGNWFLTLAACILTGLSISDSQSGFKAFTADAYRKMKLTSDRYGVCSEMAFEASRNGLKYCEVEIPTIYKNGRERHGTTFFDGVRIFFFMVGMGLRRMRMD